VGDDPVIRRTAQRRRVGALVVGVLALGFLLGAGPAKAGPAGVYPGGGVFGFGDAATYPLSQSSFQAPAVSIAATPDGHGYWIAAADGEVATAGDASSFGSALGAGLRSPVVQIAPTPTGTGYWLVDADGTVKGFGSAVAFGSLSSIGVTDDRVVGMAVAPQGTGYWLADANGSVYSFGTAQFHGSLPGIHVKPAAPIVGIVATPDGGGYWLVGADGGVFSFGDARFSGSAANMDLNAGIVGMAATPDGGGYWLVGGDGGVFSFGDARFFGSLGGDVPAFPVSAIAATPDGGGYWLLEPDGFRDSLSDPPDPGNALGREIAAIADGQVGPTSQPGTFCNPYGPCEPWCALFATWAWEAAGVPIPRYAFVGDVYDWAQAHTAVLPPTATPAPGDAVLYGTSPASVAGSPHMGIVAEVWPNGAIVTVEGDAGPGPAGSLGVVVNGPFLPADSASEVGFPIYGYALP
jgi:uncharacterized membrane protein YgdD (TMEM256/DUF423 family)